MIYIKTEPLKMYIPNDGIVIPKEVKMTSQEILNFKNNVLLTLLQDGQVDIQSVYDLPSDNHIGRKVQLLVDINTIRYEININTNGAVLHLYGNNHKVNLLAPHLVVEAIKILNRVARQEELQKTIATLKVERDIIANKMKRCEEELALLGDAK